jgi:hypothetical protein
VTTLEKMDKEELIYLKCRFASASGCHMQYLGATFFIASLQLPLAKKKKKIGSFFSYYYL